MTTTAGKIIMVFGIILILGALFAPIYLNPYIALFVIIAGIIAIVMGYRMKAKEEIEL